MSFSFLKSAQKRMEPSFFSTKTIGDDHGLSHDAITPRSSIFQFAQLMNSNASWPLLDGLSLANIEDVLDEVRPPKIQARGGEEVFILRRNNANGPASRSV